MSLRLPSRFLTCILFFLLIGSFQCLQSTELPVSSFPLPNNSEETDILNHERLYASDINSTNSTSFFENPILESTSDASSTQNSETVDRSTDDFQLQMTKLKRSIYLSFATMLVQLQIPFLLYVANRLRALYCFFIILSSLVVGSCFAVLGNQLQIDNKLTPSNAWLSVSSLISVMAVTALSWMTVLSCKPVVRCLMRFGIIFVSRNKRRLRVNTPRMIKLGLHVGNILSIFTFNITFFGIVERITGQEYSYCTLLVFFSPSLVLLTSVTLCVFFIDRFCSQAVMTEYWLRLQLRQLEYFSYFLMAVVLWLLGYWIVISKDLHMGFVFGFAQFMILAVTAAKLLSSNRFHFDSLQVDLPEDDQAIFWINLVDENLDDHQIEQLNPYY